MSDIWSTFPWDLIPDSLKAEETRAFSTAMGNAFHRMLPYTGRVSGHASIDMLPDEILDLLAVELKTQYYREDLPQDTKRELIRQTIPWYMQAGTPSVIREYLGTVMEGKRRSGFPTAVSRIISGLTCMQKAMRSLWAMGRR